MASFFITIMMHRIFIIFITLLCLSGNSQTLEVVYNVQIDISGTSMKPFNHQYVLTNSSGKSSQSKYLVGDRSAVEIDKNMQSSSLIKVGNDTTYVYKDFLNNKMFSNESIFTKSFSVADDLNIFSWKIEEGNLNVLNHLCRKASTTFRGRKFVAYFADDIPVSDGPGKFNGLPGLILKVTILGGVAIYSIDASAITLNPANSQIINPFDVQHVMPFKDFKKEYNNKYSELESFSSEQSGDSSLTITRGGLELLSDD